MRKLAMAVALTGAIGGGLAISGSAQATPATPALGDAALTLNVVDQAQYVYGGRKHCWYGAGWHGAGWYRCGYATRRGYGWGGPAGWNGWAAPGVVVAVPGVAVGVGPYYWGGRHYAHRRWHGGRWVYY